MTSSATEGPSVEAVTNPVHNNFHKSLQHVTQNVIHPAVILKLKTGSRPLREPQQVFFVATKRCISGGAELSGAHQKHAAVA